MLLRTTAQTDLPSQQMEKEPLHSVKIWPQKRQEEHPNTQHGSSFPPLTSRLKETRIQLFRTGTLLGPVVCDKGPLTSDALVDRQGSGGGGQVGCTHHESDGASLRALPLEAALDVL